MPVMPPYQANPCIEPPGFVVPHTHLHLMDYRRMLNPQYYQTMAYHSRRFRYQHNGTTKQMTSSEVQTEPLSVPQRTSNIETSGVSSVCSSDTSSVSTSQLSLPVSAVQKEDHCLEVKDTVPQNGGFVIQTEEVRIECCTTPVGLQLLHSHNAAEMSHRFSQDVVQCSSILQSSVLQDEGLSGDQEEQALQACPDILLGGTSSTGEKMPALEETKNQTTTDFPTNHIEEDLSTPSNNFDFKVVHLPFDPKYLDELRRMESAVWSMEETLVPSPKSLSQNGCTDSVVAQVPSGAVLTVQEEPPTAVVVATVDPEDMVRSVEGPGDEMGESVMGAEETPTTEVGFTHNLFLLDNSPLKGDVNQHGQEPDVQDHQDTSFESLPAYLPSTSWITDFDSPYYSSKVPAPPRKQNKPQSNRPLDVPNRRRKLDLEYKKPPAPKPKERYKPKGKVDRRSLSDHECCLSRSFNENAFSPYVPKMERLCSRCMAKHRMCTPASPRHDGRSLKRKAAPFQQWNDALVPTCETCKSHNKKRLMRKGSNPDVRVPHHGHDTEGESSENSLCRTGQKWRAADDPRRLADLKLPLASKQNTERHPKPREKNCVCNEQQLHQRLHHCPHGNAIREMDENCAMVVSFQEKWRNMDQIYLTRRWQTGKQFSL